MAAIILAEAAALWVLEGALSPQGYPNSVLVIGKAETPGLLMRYALLDIEESLAVGAPTEVGGGGLDALRLVAAPSPGRSLRAVARGFGGAEFSDPRIYLQAKEGDQVEFRLGAAGEFAMEDGVAWVAARFSPGDADEDSAEPRWLPLAHCLAPWEG